MDKSKILKNKRVERVPVHMNIPKTASEFMKEQNISPTGLFMEALKDLGYKK